MLARADLQRLRAAKRFSAGSERVSAGPQVESAKSGVPSGPIAPQLLSIAAALLDMTMIAIACFAASAAIDFPEGTQAPVPRLVGEVLLLAGILLSIHSRLGLYTLDFMRELRRAGKRLTLGILLAFASLRGLLLLLGDGRAGNLLFFILWLIAAPACVLAGRLLFQDYIHRIEAHNGFRQRIALYGDKLLADRLASQLRSREGDSVVVGIYSEESTQVSDEPSRASGLAHLLSDARLIGLERVILALPLTEKARIQRALALLAPLDADIELCPGLGWASATVIGCSSIGQSCTHLLAKRSLSPSDKLKKRCLDVMLSVMALTILAPLFVVIGVIIRLDSPGPIFFRQRRYGESEKPFRVYKFRTMSVMEDGDFIAQAHRGDKRVTRVGQLLRKTSIDELPQLINVLRGEMSIVGPRPHALSHNTKFASKLSSYSRRHRVKPGMTGWAQIHGCRGEINNLDDLTDRTEHDLYYIENWSLWLDMAIIARTIPAIMRTRAAY